MKRKLLVVLCATLSLTFGVTTVYAGPKALNGKPFVMINEQILEVEGNLQQQIDDITDDVESIDDRINAIQTAISTLQNLSENLQALIDQGIASSLEDIQAEIDFLTASNTALAQDVSVNTAELQAEIDANEKLIARLSSAVTMVQSGLLTLDGSFQAQIEDNNTIISNLVAEIDGIELKLAEKQNLLNGFCSDGEAITNIGADGSVSCGVTGGGGVGQLEMERRFKSSAEDLRDQYPPLGYVPFGTTVKVNVFCQDGWVASGSGINWSAGWDIVKNSTEGSNTASWASIMATNNNSFADFFTASVNCIRVVE